MWTRPSRNCSASARVASSVLPKTVIPEVSRSSRWTSPAGRLRCALALQFREGRVHKRYLAACGPGLGAHGSQGLIELPLSKDPARPGRYRASRTANGVPASTVWRLLHAAPEYALVALFPRTGRTHQLRAHLTALGAPILGDARYGGAAQALGEKVPRCLLHAQALSLRHPLSGASLLLEAPLPDDLARFFADAGLRAPEGEVRE